MQVSSPPTPSVPAILLPLPDPNVPEGVCPRRTRQEIDLLLLAIEALDLLGAEAILAAAQELDLQSVIPNRVVLWKLRATNPLRRNSQRRPLSLTEGKALTVITCHLARRLTVRVRQLLFAHEQYVDKEIKPDQYIGGLANYLERFRAHFRSRMNPKRSAVAVYNSDETLNELALNLLSQLLFCTGTAGSQRLWSSLFDGEVV